MKMTANAESPPRNSRLWLWIVAILLMQVTAWTTWLVIAARHKVAEVPLATAR
jgi:hypothetical protein